MLVSPGRRWQVEESIRAFEAEVQQHPENSDAWLSLGASLLRGPGDGGPLLVDGPLVDRIEG